MQDPNNARQKPSLKKVAIACVCAGVGIAGVSFGSEIVNRRNVVTNAEAPAVATATEQALPTEGAVGDPKQNMQRLARAWGIDGFARCGNAQIDYMAAAINSQDADAIQAAKLLGQIMANVKPLVDLSPDGSLSDAAFKSYSMEHPPGSLAATVAAVQRCGAEIKAASRSNT